MHRLFGNIRGVAAVAGALLLAPASARAQGEQDVQQWTLRGLHAGMCISFLMDSSAAERQMSRDFHPRPASEMTGLNPAVERTAGEGEYGKWIPSDFCLFYGDSLQMGGDIITHDPIRDNRDRELLAVWLVAAAPNEGQGSPDQYFTPVLLTSNWRVSQRAQSVLIRADHTDAEAGKSPDSTEDDRYRVKVGKTTLIWDGHLAESAQAAEDRQQIWVTRGFRGSRTNALVDLRPDSAQAVAGLLRIQGKGDLADALRASPIRMVGPFVWGGTLELRFVRR